MKSRVCLFCSVVLLFACCVSATFSSEPTTIMPLGDSITEGGSAFVVYRRALLQKLEQAGYQVRYVGSRQRGSFKEDSEPLPHEGYGGQNVGQLAEKFEALYRRHPADILLIHAGHNQFADQKPVPGMINSTRQIITTAQRLHPKVIVLVAQVIPSGKLPKYAYIPEFNEAIGRLAVELNSTDHPVIAVNQAEGFDWQKDTIADRVHPNASGAGKMAAHWFETLQKVLPKPAAAP